MNPAKQVTAGPDHAPHFDREDDQGQSICGGFTMIRFTLVALLAATFSLMASPGQAAGFGIYFSGPRHHVDYGYHGYHGGWPGHHGWYGDRWHDTSHYDYHPGEFIRHRNHYHYVPGHYDFHPSGHWDHYHW
jgi:hypothetical protein